jgi:hypothetical protein
MARAKVRSRSVSGGNLPRSQRCRTAYDPVASAAPAVTTGSAAMISTKPSSARSAASRRCSCQPRRTRAGRAGADSAGPAWIGLAWMVVVMGQPFRPLVLMPSTSIRWKARKNRKTGSSDSTDMANIGPTALVPVESRNARSPMGTVNFVRSFR